MDKKHKSEKKPPQSNTKRSMSENSDNIMKREPGKVKPLSSGSKDTVRRPKRRVSANRDEKNRSQVDGISNERLLDTLVQLYSQFSPKVTSSQNKSNVKDVKTVIDRLFRENGLKIFGNPGEKYSSFKHDPLLFIKKDNINPGTVLELREFGLQHGRKIVKKAKVTVSK